MFVLLLWLLWLLKQSILKICGAKITTNQPNYYYRGLVSSLTYAYQHWLHHHILLLLIIIINKRIDIDEIYLKKWKIVYRFASHANCNPTNQLIHYSALISYATCLTIIQIYLKLNKLFDLLSERYLHHIILLRIA